MHFLLLIGILISWSATKTTHGMLRQAEKTAEGSSPAILEDSLREARLEFNGGASAAREIQCFTCTAKRMLEPLQSDDVITTYESLVEQGYWRVGNLIFPPCNDCHQRHARIRTQRFVEKYFHPDFSLNSQRNKWKHNYKRLYKTLSIEFLPIDQPNEEILSIYKHSTGHDASWEDFKKDFGSSPIGSLSSEAIRAMNSEIYDSRSIGSVFALLRSEGLPVAVILLDFSRNWIGFKSFWYRDPLPEQNKPTMVKIIWLKSFEISEKFKFPYAMLSYFDPFNPRLTYKLNYSDLIEINARNDGNWIPMEDLIEIGIDERGERFIRDPESYLSRIK